MKKTDEINEKKLIKLMEKLGFEVINKNMKMLDDIKDNINNIDI